uniref:hypothetical protein n=1 Tax=Cupriavidus ulmosensis TaxID=3065913 RepID=UPI003F85FD8D
MLSGGNLTVSAAALTNAAGASLASTGTTTITAGSIYQCRHRQRQHHQSFDRWLPDGPECVIVTTVK